MSNEINNLYEFANFRFDAEKGKLWQDEKLILLSPKATELLKLLLEENGEFVSKEDIFDRVWADTFVEDGVLTQNIYTLLPAKILRKTIKPLQEMLAIIACCLVCDQSPDELEREWFSRLAFSYS